MLIIIVLGFNHNLYHKSFSYFIENNVDKPYKFIKNNFSKNKTLIYIDTMPPEKHFFSLLIRKDFIRAII